MRYGFAVVVLGLVLCFGSSAYPFFCAPPTVPVCSPPIVPIAPCCEPSALFPPAPPVVAPIIVAPVAPLCVSPLAPFPDSAP
jgi:hypothetical protein